MSGMLLLELATVEYQICARHRTGSNSDRILAPPSSESVSAPKIVDRKLNPASGRYCFRSCIEHFSATNCLL
jgi:hypothetical protein